ncbi:MAG TPA: hypothetical protein VMM12_07370 [Longimicrobiales bacterium]|nr:hypothetical protein [Longimicrobiales bacterium]
MWTPLILAVLQGAPAPADSQPAFRPDSAALATAYATAEARELVRQARARRGMIDGSVFRYRAAVRQRLSVGLRALRRDRLLYRRETAAVVDWRRDGPTTVEVLGAREAVPVALPGLRIPDDLEEFVVGMVPRPGGNELVLSISGPGFAWHPLVEGGEAVYRYAIGDSTDIRLPDGRQIRLVELRVTPRERDIRLITGSFWIERDSHAIVQAVFRPSRDFDLERDLRRIDPDDDDADDVPGILKPVRLDVRYMTVEYGLWEMRWWMPRLVLLDGSLQLGPAHFPVSFEITYSDYDVEPDRYGLPELPPVMRKLAGDPTARARPFQHGTIVTVRDSAGLVTSAMLPGSLYDEGASLITESEIRDLGRRLGALPPTPWELERPRFSWPWQARRGLVRYNRVEGLSAGARMDLGLGRAAVDVTARLGTADLEPAAELGVDLPTLRRTWRAAAYHRLAVADPAVNPLGVGNSMNALLFGRDDGSYFRATGAELRVAPAPAESRYELRLFAERQAGVDRNTDFSLPGLFDEGWSFPANIQADPADQLGVAAAVEVNRGLDPGGFRWGVRAEATAETGDFTFVRPGLSARAAFPLGRPLLGAVEVGGGTILGTAGDATIPGEPDGRQPRAPRQSLWYLGGPATVRGFRGAAATGADYVRGRVEVATAFPAARLALFTDAGWAGDADTFRAGAGLLSAGVGASFLDGLLRLDLARALNPERAWRLELYVDALF